MVIVTILEDVTGRHANNGQRVPLQGEFVQLERKYMVPRKEGRASVTFPFLYDFSPKFYTFIKKF